MAHEALNKALRAGYAQFDRIVRLDTPLGEDWLVPVYVRARARLGRNFEIIVDTVSAHGTKIKLGALALKSVTLWIQQGDGSYLPIHGYVQRVRRLGSDGPLTYYQIAFSSWLSFLKLSSDRRDWQEESGRQILSDVFDKHPQARGQYRFDVSAPIRSYSQRVQWEYDWNFVHRSMEEVGIFPRFEFAKDGQSHTVVVIDDLFTAPSLPERDVSFSRSGTEDEFDGLTQWCEQQEVQSGQLTTGTFDYMRPDLPKGVQASSLDQDELPAQGEDYDYTGAYTWGERELGEQQARIRTEEWASRAKRFYGIGGMRYAMPGHWFKLVDHPELDAEPEQEREMAIVASDMLIQNNVPGVEQLARFPNSLRTEVEQARAMGGGSTVHHADGGVGFVRTEIEAQRRRVPFRSPFEHRKPEMHLQTGIVAGPDNEEIYTDAMNRVKVWLTWSRKARNERASAWIRPAMPDAGFRRGGHFALRAGDEVLIGFVNGDCDRPVVISRLHGGATKPVWHTHGLLSGFRSKEYGGDGFNQLVMDDASGQNRVHLYSTSYDTHLHLGYLIQQTDNTRGPFAGSGFDLKSAAHGAIRASQGIVVSTHPPAAQPLNVSAATEQLANAEAVLETASKASETNRAESLQDGYAALRSFSDATQHPIAGSTTNGGRTAGGGTGSANGFAKPVMLLSSPAGIAASTQQSAHVSASQHANVVAGRNINLAAGKSLLASVLDRISLFAQNLGVKIFAAKGTVEIQAQTDAMTLAALKDLKVESTNGRLILTADKEVWIGAGGSYIKITSGLIENGTSGQILEKCASWDKPAAGTATVKDALHGSPVRASVGRDSDFSG